jgi:hypothetical protein
MQEEFQTFSLRLCSIGVDDKHTIILLLLLITVAFVVAIDDRTVEGFVGNTKDYVLRIHVFLQSRTVRSFS